MAFIKYDFSFEDGRHWSHDVRLTPDNSLDARQPLPDWTRLDHKRCSHCPLDADSTPQCPLAVRLVDPVEALAGIPSWTPVTARVTSAGRTVVAETSLQRAAGSLIGLLSALSGCPHTKFMSPMAMFHLPFSTSEETLFRVLGMYLTAQHLRQAAGLSVDWEMTQLTEIYRNLRLVNNGLAGRIRSAAEHESSVNAIVLLDVLASDVGTSIEEAEQELREAFAAYLAPG